MQFLIATTFAVISLVGVVSPCPAVCSCSYGMVNCKYRGLNSIPTDIPYNTTNLDLSHNAISEIERGTFIKLPRLRSIDLSHNAISEMERFAFIHLSSLRSIDLSHNAISEIERGAFFNLSSLRSINLNANKIARVEAWFLDGMPVINQLLMKYNNITFVSEKAFQNRTDLDIQLQMFCGCSDNYPLWRWLRATNKFQQIMSCYYHIGLYLEDLVPRNFHNCSVTTSRTAASPASRTTDARPSRTTAPPTIRTTSTPRRTTTMTGISAARISVKKLETPTFVSPLVIGIAIGAGSLAACLLLFGVIWRLWRQSKRKGDKFEMQPDKIVCDTSNTTE